MPVDTKLYTDNFFTEAERLAGPSAGTLVEILMKHFRPRTVVDIGCGHGLYLKEFADRGAEILGYDGAPAARKISPVGDKIRLHDLSQPLKPERRFDLCLCIEVAEHLPVAAADTLIETLISFSDKIVFTAAVPGQAPLEYGHINERPHVYWIKKFIERSFKYNRPLTLRMRQEMKEKKVIWWVVNNLMIFEK